MEMFARVMKSPALFARFARNFAYTLQPDGAKAARGGAHFHFAIISVKYYFKSAEALSARSNEKHRAEPLHGFIPRFRTIRCDHLYVLHTHTVKWL